MSTRSDLHLLLWVRIPLEVYSMQHYVITFVNDLGEVGVTPVSSTNKIDRHDITETLLRVTLITITLTLTLINRCINN
jgi:hypothetical protein